MSLISKETSDRVCNHMNKDHIDSVYKYLKHYGKISNFNKAFMEEISSKGIKIKYDDKICVIYFKNEISEEEIHPTLVSMIKSIK